MPDPAASLAYDGQVFPLVDADVKRLKKIFSSGLSISSVLFTFRPVGAHADVTIAVGGGAPLTLHQPVPGAPPVDTGT